MVCLYITQKKGVLISVGAFGQYYPARKDLICNMSDPVVFSASLHPEEK